VLLSILLGFLTVFYSSVGKVEVSALGTDIGIREDGPSKAQVGDTISYVITVINLGDYWDRNLTVTDRFPNGTSSSWNIPDLAPLLQSGHQFTVNASRITNRPVRQKP